MIIVNLWLIGALRNKEKERKTERELMVTSFLFPANYLRNLF